MSFVNWLYEQAEAAGAEDSDEYKEVASDLWKAGRADPAWGPLLQKWYPPPWEEETSQGKVPGKATPPPPSLIPPSGYGATPGRLYDWMRQERPEWLREQFRAGQEGGLPAAFDAEITRLIGRVPDWMSEEHPVWQAILAWARGKWITGEYVPDPNAPPRETERFEAMVREWWLTIPDRERILAEFRRLNNYPWEPEVWEETAGFLGFIEQITQGSNLGTPRFK